MKKRIGFMVILSLITVQLFGGWVIETVENGEDEEPLKQIFYIQDNKMKVAGEETIIFDLDREIMIFIDHEKKVYFAGNPSEIISGAKSSMMEMMEERLKDLPPDQQEMIKKQMEEMGADGTTQASPKKKVAVKKTSKNDRVAGYSVNLFEIMVNDEHTEDLWIAPKVSLAGELDLDKLTDFMKNMKMGEADYTSADEYISLFREGFPLRTVHYNMGYKEVSVSEAVKVEKRAIPASEFNPPAGYEKKEMAEMMQMMNE
jgi:hypothetical protein